MVSWAILLLDFTNINFSSVGKIYFTHTNPEAVCSRTSPYPSPSLPFAVCRQVAAHPLPAPAPCLPRNCKMKQKQGGKSLWSPNHTGYSLLHALLCAENLSLQENKNKEEMLIFQRYFPSYIITKYLNIIIFCKSEVSNIFSSWIISGP